MVAKFTEIAKIHVRAVGGHYVLIAVETFLEVITKMCPVFHAQLCNIIFMFKGNPATTEVAQVFSHMGQYGYEPASCRT